MPKLTQQLPDGPLAIVGDVHGEIEALDNLLARLGFAEGKNPGRTLVFVGDLVDRGPDSVAVIKRVVDLVNRGLAVAILGNHELNILRGEVKDGNGWYHGVNQKIRVTGHGDVWYNFQLATKDEREYVQSFLETLPLVVERADLRVVHACWNPPAMERLPQNGRVVDLMQSIEQEIKTELANRGVLDAAEVEKKEFSDLEDINHRPTRFLENVATAEFELQAGNPIKVLTSGIEAFVAPGAHFFAGGKWRFLSRDNWWNRPVDRATVVGHYWRNRGPVQGGKEAWDDVPPFAWCGDVFCVDYSVGYRFRERISGNTAHSRFGLAALLWPEREVVFDDRQGQVASTGLGSERAVGEFDSTGATCISAAFLRSNDLFYSYPGW